MAIAIMIIMESQPREIQRYVTPEGKVPFAEWLDSLRDRKARLKIQTKLRRIHLGNWGDYRSLGEGVYEFKINYGTWLSDLFWTSWVNPNTPFMWWR